MRRRPQRWPWIIGLTGSIAMGKTTVATMLRGCGVPVFDADAAVHRLTAPNGTALEAISAQFPGVVSGGVLDRRKLAERVFANQAALHDLERILHPRVGEQRRAWLGRQRRRRARVVVNDVPLLFETGGETGCHQVWVVTAPAFLQRQRVLRRAGMTPEKLAAVLRRQTPDAVKRRRADVVLPSGLGRAFTLRRIKRALRILVRIRKARHA